MKIYRTCFFIFFPALAMLVISCGQEKNGSMGKEGAVDYSSAIAPIINKNCAPCHHKGGAGPFPLTSYKDVRRKAQTIVKVTSSHFMPPWPADVNYRHFAGEKHLTEEEIALIKKWVDAGCAAGDTSHLVPVKDYQNSSIYGKPDAVVRMREPFPIKGDNRSEEHTSELQSHS